MMRLFILIFLLTSTLLAQNKIDSLFLLHDQNEVSSPLRNNGIQTNDKNETLPLQYLQLQNRMDLLDGKSLSSNKILFTEMMESYKFSEEEFNCGLSEDQLISYLRNKKTTLKILADTYYQHTDVNWDKIERILGISKKAFAIILGMISLVR
jgi:hypothetical protein